MTSALRIILAIAVSVTLFGCSYDYLAEQLIPEEESAYAQDFLERLRNRDFDYVIGQVDSSISAQISEQKLIEIADYFPAGEPAAVEIIGSQTFSSPDLWQGNFTFEYQFDDGWAVANIVINRVNEITTVTGFHVWQTTASQRELTAFSAADLTPWHIIILVLTVLVPAFMIFTCYRVYKTPIPARKRRWYLISFLGLFGFTFNWTTSVLNYELATVKILGFGIVAASPHAPWILSFTIPVGAAVFWLMRSRLTRPSPDTPGDDIDSDATKSA